MCPRRLVEIGQEYLKAQRNGQSYLLLTYQRMMSSQPQPEEREFVVDSGVSMHMLSRKDLNSAELETVRVSRSPTTVVTANGDVHTKEEATVYVKELDSFVTVKLGRSFTRKTLRRSRTLVPLDQWSETTTHQRWQTNKVQHGELRINRCPMVYRHALQAQLHLQHQYCRKQSIPHQQEVRVRVAQYG